MVISGQPVGTVTTMYEGTIPTQYVAILADLVRHAPARADLNLFSGTELTSDDLARFDRRISLSDFNQLVQNAYRITGDPALGLHIGQRVNLSSHATLGHALMNCVDFRQAIQLFLKYYPIIAPNLEMHYVEQGERCYLEPTWKAEIGRAHV